jgi:O-antigen ligase
MNTGVAQQKNSLGVMTLVITLGTLWNFLSLLRDKDRPNRGRHLLVQGVLLAFGVWLLVLADSATSTTCFGLGAGLMLATRLRTVRRAPAAVHVLVLSLLLVGGLTFFVGGAADVTHALGRSSNLTGRTDIWAALIPAVPNKIVGAGFENFWIDYSVRGLWHSLPTLLNAQFLNEAHNGYVEIYLNLGWVGVSLIALVLITGYGKVVAAYRRDPPTGSLWMAYLIVAAFYNITEAGFRILNTMEIFLFMAVVYSSGIASGLIGGTVETAPEPVSLRSFHARQQKRLGLPLPVKRAT